MIVDLKPKHIGQGINMYNPDEECKEMIVRLKKVCEQKHMTPYALAKAAGISTSTLSYILSNKTKPQMHTVLMLCNALEISISDLFQNENEKCDDLFKQYEKRNSLTEERMLRCYRELSEHKKMLLGIYLDMLEQYKDGVE